MSNLDAELLRQLVQAASSGRLADVQVFAEIDSTNSYLMQLPGPVPGKVSIAATSNQTAGRGRHGKIWQSPAGSGLCLSAAYTFASQPGNLPALTLAIGLAVTYALEELGAVGVELKWPNDLVVLDSKLGGILTEVQRQSAAGVTVVTGIGINLNLVEALEPGMETDWARQVVDLKQVCDVPPSPEELAGLLTKHLISAFIEYEESGFEPIAERWSKYDWLRGRQITVDTGAEQASGIGAGLADDGALLIDTAEAGIRRITSGTIVFAGSRGTEQ
jgi:BirA family biotin operon repressor/biotin-[acetyl-CoA-carboxylase] ligase